MRQTAATSKPHSFYFTLCAKPLLFVLFLADGAAPGARFLFKRMLLQAGLVQPPTHFHPQTARARTLDPPSAPPSVVAVSGYPDRPTLPSMSKSKTAASALHFGKEPVNMYTGSTVKGKAPAPRSSPVASPASPASANAFAALSDQAETITVEEQATIDLLGLSEDSFTDSAGGDISSSDIDTSASDPGKALARRLARTYSCRPPTPPGTTSGAGSSATTPPSALGCAQNADGSLCEAADIVFYNDVDDETPLTAAPETSDDGSPFLTPVPSALATTSTPSTMITASPLSANIADAAAAAGRARQARATAASAPVSPARSTTVSSPPSPTNSAVPPPAQPATQSALPTIAKQPAPTATAAVAAPAAGTPIAAVQSSTPSAAQPASSDTTQAATTAASDTAQAAVPVTPAAPSFSSVVTRGQAARRAAAGPATGPSPFPPLALPSGMFIPSTRAATGAANPPMGPAVSSGAPAPQPLATAITVTAVQPQPVQQPPALNIAAPPAPPPQAAFAPPMHDPALLVAPGPVIAAAAAAAAAAGGAPPPLFTPAPPGGFPPILGLDRARLRENIADRQLVKWDSSGGFKFFIYLWNGRRHSVDSSALDDLKNALVRILRTAPLIGPAEAATPNGRSDSPFVYLVKGVSAADCQRLIAQTCWNLLGGTTFFAVPYDAAPSSFLFTIDGLLYDATEGVDVATLIVTVVSETNEAQSLLTLIHDAYPADADAMSHFASTIRVLPIALKNSRGSCRIVWNTTAAPPSLDPAANRAWCSLLSKLTFHSEMHYVGRAINPPLFCSGCKSFGHVLDICPLPLVPGWYAPTPLANTAPTAPGPGPGPANTRGGRGGGRGRGNGRGRGHN
ncbi:hypothetical protein B0H17DRAFT_1212382 [Mycena rosella]|uniref:Uncharacterized protein n=1 Tax=Mycena rosella TaxID=1033263 RepID=A0AAD7G6N3_MYCRO|nr:hypothetical protein B0H17DRAFT_1212382 [Mycena rosella]